MVKMLIVLISTMSYLQVFLLKNVSSKDISIHAKLHKHSFNNKLTNDIVSFEQLTPGVFK